MYENLENVPDCVYKSEDNGRTRFWKKPLNILPFNELIHDYMWPEGVNEFYFDFDSWEGYHQENLLAVLRALRGFNKKAAEKVLGKLQKRKKDWDAAATPEAKAKVNKSKRLTLGGSGVEALETVIKRVLALAHHLKNPFLLCEVILFINV